MKFDENFSQKPNQEIAQEIPPSKKEYMLESGAKVEIEWKVTSPLVSVEKNSRKAVVFLPGWGMQASDDSVEGLSKAFSIDTQTYTITSSSQYKISILTTMNL